MNRSNRPFDRLQIFILIMIQFYDRAFYPGLRKVYK